MIFHNVNDLIQISCEPKRRPKAAQQWWLNLVPMQRIMAKYSDADYTSETEERLETDFDQIETNHPQALGNGELENG